MPSDVIKKEVALFAVMLAVPSTNNVFVSTVKFWFACMFNGKFKSNLLFDESHSKTAFIAGVPLLSYHVSNLYINLSVFTLYDGDCLSYYISKI